MNKPVIFPLLLAASLLLAACGSAASASGLPLPSVTQSAPRPPAWQGRPEYAPGELVDYTAQTGDTLPALAGRFNTSVEEIYAANPFIPRNATTMPPGMPMRIPVYYLPLWADPYQIIPDHAYVYGPTLVGFNASAFVASHPGWLKDYRAWAGYDWRSGAEIADYVGLNYSINPRLLLALLEYQAGALSLPEKPKTRYLLGYQRTYYESVYLQLVGAANTLNNGYYGWRNGSLTEFELKDGTLIRPDPWQNAASVAVQYYFATMLPADEYRLAVSPQGLFALYTDLFGDPWVDATELIPGSLGQPDLRLPFPPGRVWTLTGGPHTGFGHGLPFAALDFAPPSEFSGCFAVDEKDYAIAMADGIVVRSETGTVVLDLDGDGDERTGWVIVYIHVGSDGRAPTGLSLKAGEPVGYPSCEGGRTTGTHIHVARKYNGEWIPADGPVPFNLEGWVAHNGSEAYLGTLTKGSLTITASAVSDLYSQIQSQATP
ncbi:MAG: LysM peptidoglycan-binding domain-containing protein [Chloroflexota bacterium]